MRKEAWIIMSIVLCLLLSIIWQVKPFRIVSDWRTSIKATAAYDLEFCGYELYDYSEGEPSFMRIDFRRGEHFWNPQVAFWIEDTAGNYISTLFVTTSTAKGLFYSGRSANNFKDYDGEKTVEADSIRRVNALPYWAHKRGVVSKDGSYAPHPSQPLPDGISGATPTDNFLLSTPQPSGIDDLKTFVLKMEVNVAFDENEYYSEYDFLDDEAYHGGTGLLGQPSLIYAVQIAKSDFKNYYLMQLVGQGHHSGLDGSLQKDLSRITTARKIVERVVIEVNF